MSERSFNQMEEIKPIIYQLLAFLEGNDYEPDIPLWMYSPDQKKVIEKALNQIKDVLEQL